MILSPTTVYIAPFAMELMTSKGIESMLILGQTEQGKQILSSYRHITQNGGGECPNKKPSREGPEN